MRAPLLIAIAACVGSGMVLEESHAQAPQAHSIAGFWSMAPGPTPPRRPATPVEAELIERLRDGALF